MDDNSMLSVLDAVAEYERPRIQEAEFVRKYLVYFTGETGDAATAIWLEVAGSPYAEVEVCNGRDVLFIVPPLLNPDQRVLGTLDEISVFETVEQIQLHHSVHPGLGKSRMRDWIISRIGSDMSGLDLARRWNDIFRRYNRPLIPLPGEPTSTAGSPAPSEYDSFDDF